MILYCTRCNEVFESGYVPDCPECGSEDIEFWDMDKVM